MKNILTLLIGCLLFFNCINKTPKLDEEEYRKEQLEYETLKEKLSTNKSAFFKENNAALTERIALFKELKDTTTVFSNVNSDSLFFLRNVRLRSLNYGRDIENGGDKIIFLPKNEEEISKYFYFKELYKKLYNYEENTEESFEHINIEVLKDFLEIKYVFVVEGFTIMEPSLDGNKTFMSGLFYGSVLVYDLINNNPLYEYNYTAANSEEIKYRDSKNSYLKEKPIDVIKQDFKTNINSAFWKETNKHFNFK